MGDGTITVSVLALRQRASDGSGQAYIVDPGGPQVAVPAEGTPQAGATAAAMRAAFAFWSAALLTPQYDEVLQWLEAQFGVQVRVRVLTGAGPGLPGAPLQALVPFSQSAWVARTSHHAHVAGYVAVPTAAAPHIRDATMDCRVQPAWGPPAAAGGRRRRRHRGGQASSRLRARHQWVIVPCGGRTFCQWMQPSVQSSGVCPVMHFVAALTLGLWDTVLAPFVGTPGLPASVPLRVHLAQEVFRHGQTRGDPLSVALPSMGGVGMGPTQGPSVDDGNDVDHGNDNDDDDDEDDDGDSGGGGADDDGDDDEGRDGKTAIRSVVINVYPGHGVVAAGAGPAVPAPARAASPSVVSGAASPARPVHTVTVKPSDVVQSSGNQEADSFVAALRVMLHLAHTRSFQMLLQDGGVSLARIRAATSKFNEYLEGARTNPATASDKGVLTELRRNVLQELRAVFTRAFPSTMLMHKQGKLLKQLMDYMQYSDDDFPQVFAAPTPRP
jgi:hypothetical protein